MKLREKIQDVVDENTLISITTSMPLRAKLNDVTDELTLIALKFARESIQ